MERKEALAIIGRHKSEIQKLAETASRHLFFEVMEKEMFAPEGQIGTIWLLQFMALQNKKDRTAYLGGIMQAVKSDKVSAAVIRQFKAQTVQAVRRELEKELIACNALSEREIRKVMNAAAINQIEKTKKADSAKIIRAVDRAVMKRYSSFYPAIKRIRRAGKPIEIGPQSKNAWVK